MGNSRRTFVAETSILTSLPLNDDDDLQLCDCQVLDPSTRQPVSLLTAATFNAVTVIGTLHALPKEKWHHYAKPEYRNKSHHIEITSVMRNAFGEYDDGTFGLWAAGETGWYDIRGADEYKSMMEFMREDIRTFYFIADAYREPRMVGKGKKARHLPDLTAQELLGEYAIKVIKDATAVKEAAEQIYQHCDFILSCMIAGNEIGAWSQNPFYRHLTRKFPQVLATVKERIFGLSAAQNAQSTTEESSAAEGHVSTRRRRVRDPDLGSTYSSASATTLLGAKDSSLAETSVGASLRRPRRGATVEEPTVEEPTAKSVSGSAEPTTPVQNHEDGAEDEDASSSDSDSGQPVARKGKSALRPRPSKGLKSSSRHSNGAHGDSSRDELLSSATAGKKKPDDPLHKLHWRKRKYSRTDVDEGIDMPSSPASSGATSELESAKTPPPAPAGATLADEALRLNHHPDPVQEDTWVCALHGCMHKVYSASKPDSQHLIKEHYKLHIYDNDERVKLVKRLQAPSLPTSHLMERVKSQAAMEEVDNSAGGSYMGPGGIVGSRVAGSRFPDPILRRL
nr:hypothetical protein CFP56_68661 [Quercus suber]